MSECKRCGECCRRFSPTLHSEDLGLLQGGKIPLDRVYTIRRGEKAYSPVQESLIILEEEMVKVREDEATGFCTFFSEESDSCLIYSHRPLQCRAFECWNTEGFARAFESPRLTRGDLIPEDSLLGRIVSAHEERCSIEGLAALFERLGKDEDAAVLDEILDLLQYDHETRPFFAQRLEIHPSHMEFVFGRPLARVVRMFGVKVVEEPGGGYRMVPVEESP